MSTSSANNISSHVARVEGLEERRLLSADVTGTFVGRVPASLSPVQTNHVMVRIVNQGDSLVNGPVSVTLYASTDAALDAGDTLLTTITRRVRLKTGQGRNLSMSFATPGTLLDGKDYLVAEVGAAAGVAGSVFASPQSVAVQQPYVDLVTDFVYLPGHPILTNGIVSTHPSAAVRIVNIGNAVARGKVSVGLFMSSSTVLDANAALAAQWKSTRVALMPGSSRLFAAGLTLPYGSMPGSYTLFGVANASGGMTVRHPADLVAAGSEQVGVVSTVGADTLLANYDRHHRHCIFYDGDDYSADVLADYGLDDVVVQGESIPPGFTPQVGPTSEPSSQPASQPSSGTWNSGLGQAANAVTAEQNASGNGNTDNPGDNWGADGGDGDGGDGGDSGDSGDSGDGDSGDGDDDSDIAHRRR